MNPTNQPNPTQPSSEPVRIAAMLYGGDGEAISASGSAVAIPFTLPNELVQLNPAALPTILEPSPNRTTPECIHFGQCGGCQYQHATYPTQLAIKETILRDTLVSARVQDLPKIEVHAAAPWHYRNRIRVRLGRAEGDAVEKLSFGYNRRATGAHEPFLPITMCPIAAPLLIRAAEALVSLHATDPAAQRWLDHAVEAELFTNADENQLQLTLFLRVNRKNTPTAPQDPAFTKLCESLERLIPQLIGAGLALLPAVASPQGRRTEHPKPGPTWGTPGLTYTVPTNPSALTQQYGNAPNSSATAKTALIKAPALINLTQTEENFWVTRGGFFQINRHLLAELALVATANRTGTLAWDLYAGVGLFTRALTRTFAQVIAVEAGEPAATDLANSLKSINKSDKKPESLAHHAVPATTLDFLQSAVLQRARPDLIVMDPPRSGVGPEVCTLLARLRTPSLVYVSCDPTTLARDLALLTANGYRLTELHLADMFPQTFHLEAVAILHYTPSV